MEIKQIKIRSKTKPTFAEQLNFDWCAVKWWHKLVILVCAYWIIYSLVKIFIIGCNCK